METLFYAIIGLLVSYFIIYISIKDAMNKTVQPYLMSQVKIMKMMAEKAGIETNEIDKAILSPKEYKKKYSTKPLGDLIK